MFIAAFKHVRGLRLIQGEFGFESQGLDAWLGLTWLLPVSTVVLSI